MAQCQKSGSRAEKTLSQKGFPKQLMLPLHTNLKMVKKDKKKVINEHVRIQPAINR